ncbi:MAG TPA: DUF4097 family beta strand repeat-containing protein [Blastocatellia bacterium]
MNIRLRMVVAAMVLGLALAGAAAAQDFQKNYNLGANGQIRIGNISGDVEVTGYNGSAVIVTAYKEGRDRDVVEIEDRSSASRVDVRARYPENCRRCDVSVRFEVKVPQSMSFDFDGISSVSGNVKIRSVTGSLRASSVSGTVRIEDVTGTVSASSVSGNVEVDINRLEGTDDMKFSSVSGNVNVRMPEGLDAQVSMSTLSGALDTDFPVEVKEKRYGPGRSASGRVGDGSRQLHMSSVSGNISLRHSR